MDDELLRRILNRYTIATESGEFSRFAKCRSYLLIQCSESGSAFLVPREKPPAEAQNADVISLEQSRGEIYSATEQQMNNAQLSQHGQYYLKGGDIVFLVSKHIYFPSVLSHHYTHRSSIIFLEFIATFLSVNLVFFGRH